MQNIRLGSVQISVLAFFLAPCIFPISFLALSNPYLLLLTTNTLTQHFNTISYGCSNALLLDFSPIITAKAYL